MMGNGFLCVAIPDVSFVYINAFAQILSHLSYVEGRWTLLAKDSIKKISLVTVKGQSQYN